MYRSEDIGARKQSAGRRVGKNVPSPMKKFPHGISVAGLRRNFGRDNASEWGHGAARKNSAGSAIGRKKSFPMKNALHGRFALGLRKKF